MSNQYKLRFFHMSFAIGLMLTGCVASGHSSAKSQMSPAAQPALSVLNAAASTNGTKQDFDISIPLIPIDEDDIFNLNLKLNGQVTTLFTVDTGSSYQDITQSLVSQLGLTSKPAVSDMGGSMYFGNKKVNGVMVNKIEFPGSSSQGQLPLINSQMIVLSDVISSPAFAKVEGVLGASLLKDFACDFDFPSKTLTLYYPGKFSIHQAKSVGCVGPGSVILPITEINDATFSNRYYIPVDVTSGNKTKVISLALDTGSDVTIIPRSLAKSLHLKSIGKEPQLGTMGNFESDIATVSLTLGGVTLPNVKVVYPAKGTYYPILGMNVLSHFHILMDFPAKKMYLVPESTSVVSSAPNLPNAKTSSLSAGKH